ncbi:MAG: glycosyltransferase family 39 protein [Candidatus Daviesbacteria bacterium]|nr:glycosyltransferase family 39 protein [Candidatus Daviesbacteria bacterium]
MTQYLNKLKKITGRRSFHVLIFFLVLIFTFILRTHNFDRFPVMGHLEEQMFAWAGIHLIERGIPRAWTSLDFPERAVVYKGAVSYNGGDPVVHVKLVEPWLEHPPLFSLLVGEFAHLYKANRDDVVPTSFIRTPLMIAALLVSIMIFLVARLISGYWSGILAMLIYGVTPILVLGSRLAVPENIIALLYIAVIYLLIKFQLHQKFRFLLTIPLLVGIAGLSKATGFFIIFLAIYTVLIKQKYKYALYLFAAILPFIALFFAYGLYFDPEIFWRINAIQSSRPVGFASLGWFFVSPAFDINELLDGWFIFLLLSAAFFLFSPLSGLKRFISLAFVFWIAVVMFSGGEADLLPWYRYPAYPLLAILGAWGLQVLVKRADLFATFLIAGLFLGGRTLLVNAFRPNVSPMNFRIIFSLLMLPSLLNSIFTRSYLEKINKLFLILIIAVGMYFNIIYIYNVFELKCESKTCAFGPTTKLSTVNFPFFWRWFVLGEPTLK